MSRIANINRAILQILDACEDYALPEDQLRTEVRGRIRPPCEDEEFTEAMEALRERRAITHIGDDLDPTLRKFLITESGKTLLARQP